MALRPILLALVGAALVVALAHFGAARYGPRTEARLEAAATAALAEAGAPSIVADFHVGADWPTRHPTLRGGAGLDEDTRARAARAIAAVPGVGGVRWSDGSVRALAGEQQFGPDHCQDDVEALLEARSMRFEEGSARIDAASVPLVDEVAEAIAPCLGSIVAIIGHTDASGEDEANLALSRERAIAVRQALIRRGAPGRSLTARGVGARAPVEGLEPGDPANRRIEFRVVRIEPLTPTPVDTPGAR